MLSCRFRIPQLFNDALRKGNFATHYFTIFYIYFSLLSSRLYMTDKVADKVRAALPQFFISSNIKLSYFGQLFNIFCLFVCLFVCLFFVSEHFLAYSSTLQTSQISWTYIDIFIFSSVVSAKLLLITPITFRESTKSGHEAKN